MNIFVLNAGRCGSTTFVQACRHVTNYTSGHESRCALLGPERLAYPDDHIEADNRLAWLLGRLERAYGDDAFYIHLRRDPDATARSFARRHDFGIMKAYREGVLLGFPGDRPRLEVARDYLDTVEANIELFLGDKTRRMTFQLENAAKDFRIFWKAIGAEGDLDAALREFETAYNASPTG